MVLHMIGLSLTVSTGEQILSWSEKYVPLLLRAPYYYERIWIVLQTMVVMIIKLSVQMNIFNYFGPNRERSTRSFTGSQNLIPPTLIA